MHIRKICLGNLLHSYYERVWERGQQIVYCDVEKSSIFGHIS
jgi:hypothetical protein